MDEIVKQLKVNGFTPLFKFWDRLSKEDQRKLLGQIQHLDLAVLQRQRAALHSTKQIHSGFLEPFSTFSYKGNKQDVIEGRKLIQEGRLGCLVLAGGQGSRLQFQGPKGMYPVSIIKHKSLFQLIAEKIIAAGKQADTILPLAIMTSPQNDTETRYFFSSNHFFGLKEEQITFFPQGTLPLMTNREELFLEEPALIATGANGNGYCFRELVQSGIWPKWRSEGIDYLNIILIDNVLADPFDAELLGFHCRQQVDITLKCTVRDSIHENVGLLVQQNEKSRVVEYSEISHSERTALDASGNFKHRIANLSLFCVSGDFVEKAAALSDTLPLHAAWKACQVVDEKGKTFRPTEPNAWKFESFIFDNLEFTDKIAALVYPRSESFAPLKNPKGNFSITTVQEALQNREKQIIEEITGLPAPSKPFELSMDFYYPTLELLEKWAGQSIEAGYVDSE